MNKGKAMPWAIPSITPCSQHREAFSEGEGAHIEDHEHCEIRSESANEERGPSQESRYDQYFLKEMSAREPLYEGTIHLEPKTIAHSAKEERDGVGSSRSEHAHETEYGLVVGGENLVSGDVLFVRTYQLSWHTSGKELMSEEPRTHVLEDTPAHSPSATCQLH